MKRALQYSVSCPPGKQKVGIKKKFPEWREQKPFKTVAQAYPWIHVLISTLYKLFVCVFT